MLLQMILWHTCLSQPSLLFLLPFLHACTVLFLNTLSLPPFPLLKLLVLHVLIQLFHTDFPTAPRRTNLSPWYGSLRGCPSSPPEGRGAAGGARPRPPQHQTHVWDLGPRSKWKIRYACYWNENMVGCSGQYTVRELLCYSWCIHSAI